MALRLALLTAVFCVGCGTALPEGVPAKGAAAETTAADAPQGKETAPAKTEEAKEDEVKGHVTVRCVPAQKRSLAVTVDSLGRTELLPESLGSLTATVEGHVHKLLVNLGDSVTAGQPIVELDTTVARTALAEKLANRDSLQAALRLLESHPRPEECRAAELAVEQAELGLEHAQAIVERLRPLAARQEVSPQQFADAQHTLKQDGLLRATAEAQLKLLKLGPRPEAVAEAQTKIAIAEQAVANARATLDFHTLRSPIAGIVDSLNCHPGQTLTIGTPVGEVVNRRRLIVTVYLPTRAVRNVEAGMPVRIDLVNGENRDPSPGKSDELNGQVAFVGAVADPQTGNFPTRVLVDNADGRLRVGQVVKATVKLRTEQSAIAVPQKAIFDQGEGPLLAVVRDGKIKQLHPELGAAEGGLVVVTKTDLHEGEMVVTEGAYSVPEGTDATIAQTAAAEPVKHTETAKAGEPAKVGEHE
ncbi:MAG TPA: efflux RND transporter periplasmic adaptor subunit [Planctomycetaceae bacterium]|jgi:multidrug efflux pump subunit AcrA (membrane-fusion protein)|nr:efflux RND transporter periplasmic adaptor subunit [Planctomycetaceae bacterium]